MPEALIGPYLSAAKARGILAPMYLELTTGLRRGELLALRWEDLGGSAMNNDVQEDVMNDQMNLKEFVDPFTGEKSK